MIVSDLSYMHAADEDNVEGGGRWWKRYYYKKNKRYTNKIGKQKANASASKFGVAIAQNSAAQNIGPGAALSFNIAVVGPSINL